MITSRFVTACILATGLLLSNTANADELIWLVNAGGWQQSNSVQDNRMAGADLIFYRNEPGGRV